MDTFKTKVFVKAKLSALTLTVGKYYEISRTFKHFDSEIFVVTNDIGEVKGYNSGHFF